MHKMCQNPHPNRRLCPMSPPLLDLATVTILIISEVITIIYSICTFQCHMQKETQVPPRWI